MSSATEAIETNNGAGDELRLANIGPVHELTIKLPSEGGVTLVCGQNGSGKSHTLNAVQSLVAGKGKVPVRDHAKRGEVEGFGAVMRVGATTRRSGEVDVISLEGRFDLSVLYDPGIANEEAADARRIKALVQLAGAKADHTLFHRLLTSQAEFDQLVDPESIKTDDLVTMGARIKRDIDKAALAAERESVNLSAQVKAAREAAEGVDLSLESDEATLTANHERAIEARSRLTTEAEHRRALIAKAAKAKEQLEASAANRTVPTVEAAVKAEAEALRKSQESLAKVNDAQAKVDELEAALTRAKDALAYEQAAREQAKQAHQAAIDVHRSALAYEETLADWRRQLTEASNVGPVSAEDLAAADEAVRIADAAKQTGTLVRKAKQDLLRADQAEAQAKETTKRAERLRDAAKGTDDVLSDAVKSDVLRVSAGRLVLETARGKDTPFAELSDGERWRVALIEAAKAVGEGGIIVLPQTAWDGIDPIQQVKIHELARELKIHILTGKRTADKELCSREFKPEEAS